MSFRYQPLANYLRSHRQQTALLQRDVALLLGEGNDGTTVSRHEQSQNLPDLRTALAYELIYGAFVRELFEGEFHAVEVEVKRRAKKLLLEVRRERVTPENVARVDQLAQLAGNPTEL